jgi:protein arginine kinase
VSDGGFSLFSAQFVRQGAEWLRGQGADADVVISSRIRLARNLKGFPFVKRSPRAIRERVLQLCRERLTSPDFASGAGKAGDSRILWVDVHACTPLDRTLLVERHLISKEHARQGVPTKPGDEASATPPNAPGAGEPRGVAISLPDERLSIMVNEEDHLRIQVIRSGLDLAGEGGAFDQINAVDDRLEGLPGAGGLEYAFSPRFGYLTACPTNVGTGIRVSVMLHLPGLKLTGEMEKVKRATRDLSLAVRGYYGEGSEAVGDFYQISNQTTLGKPERIILHQFEREIIPQVIEYERAARRLLLEKRRRFLEDQVMRALGTLRYARLLTPEESLTLLSQVRLGIVTGLITDIPESTVNQLILLTQPAHLQRVVGRDMDQNQRREARADLVRQQLSI